MEPDAGERPPISRFLESFFQERSIRWMLGVGGLILLGSSLALVTTHWERSTPLWKYLVLAGYTAATFAAGRIAERQLGLRRTGTVLQGLTVLLIPITFYALNGLRASAPRGLAPAALQLALLSASLAASALAARSIFRRFLHGSQPTFLLSYLVLSLAGAVAPGLDGSWSRIAAALSWGAFTVGTVKVSRHVFWLAEERRAPRLLGFFPSLILGGQFLGLFASSFAHHLPADWMGFACVLVAAPVLLTADAAARVFERRTGGLVWPWPLSIAAPLGLALLLTAGGAALAATGLSSPRGPYPLVPAALTGAFLLGVVAHRTRKPHFVWGMLLLTVLAYNFSPVFFQELAREAVRGGARAVREEKLPYAFYGLTYLPLVAAASLAAVLASRRGSVVFAPALRRFAIGIPALLLPLSMSHPKALFPVALATAIVFAAQSLLFRDRRLVLAAIAAATVAAAGTTSFAREVLRLKVRADQALLTLELLAVALLIPGGRIDRWARSLPLPAPPDGDAPAGRAALQAVLDSPCRLASLALSLAAAGFWALRFGLPLAASEAWPSAALASGLLLAHSLLWLRPGLGEAALGFSLASAALVWLSLGAEAGTVVSAAIPVLLLLWIAGGRAGKRPEGRTARALAGASLRVSLIGLLAALALAVLPSLAASTFALEVPPSAGKVFWPCQVLTLAWAFACGFLLELPALGALGSAGVLGLVGSTFLAVAGSQAREWLPAACAAAVIAALPAVQLLLRHAREAAEPAAGEAGARASNWRAVALPAYWCSLFTLGALAGVAVVDLSLPLRVSGALAVLGLLWLAAVERRPALRSGALLALNWQAIGLAAQVATGFRAGSLLGVLEGSRLPAALPVALAAAASLHWPRLFTAGGNPLLADLGRLHRLLLWGVAGLATASTLALDGLTTLQAWLAAATFGVLVLALLRAACRDRSEREVWIAEAVAALAVAYLARFGIIHFGHGISLYAILGSALMLWALGRWAGRRETTAVLAGPFLGTAMVLPLAAVLLGIGRHLLGPPPAWRGLRSLAILLAGGFYFWRGIETRSRGLLVIAAAAANAALVLLWRELEWTDPQLYMIPAGVSVLVLVEVLKREIPPRLLDPLRYLGALVILVSPVFHIVEGSWLHVVTLMVASVAVVLAAIGLRVRALMYAGTAFLAADLAAMVVRRSIEDPNTVWIAGLALGAAVIALAAWCENQREAVQSRLRAIAAALETWE